MKRISAIQVLAVLMLLQAVFYAPVPLNSIRVLSVSDPVSGATVIAMLSCWLLLIAGSFGLLLKKPWSLWFLTGCAVLTPLFMLPMIPFVTKLFPASGWLLLSAILILNFGVLGLAYFLFPRKDEDKT